jgi:hypothetical protein
LIRASRSGQAGLFVVLNLTLVFGTLGLAVDLGWAYYKRNAAQTAADAAAMAAVSYAGENGFTCGVNGVICGSSACSNPNVSPPTNNLQVGCLYAGANGYLNGGSQTVTLQGNTGTPPGLSGNNPAYWVQASVSENTNNFFGRFGGISAFTVNTVATAGLTVTPPANCIYVLDPSASGAFTATGTTSVTASCGVFVNSNSSSAFTMSGNSTVSAATILVNGGTSLSGGAYASPSPQTGQGSVADPLASLPMPTYSGCDHTNFSTSGGGTLNPGVYCGGISISGSATTHFNPGSYILVGGGFKVSGSGTLKGTGVTFFNTGSSTYPPGTISTSGSATLDFSAPSSGIYQGMLFVQDRNWPYSGTNSVSGSSSSVMSGTLYFPNTALSYSGTSAGSYTAIVADTVTFTGTSYLLNDPSGNLTGLTGRTVSLIQ